MKPDASGGGARISVRTAVAAPAEQPTDDCNWLPMSAMKRTLGTEAMLKLMCRMPCVQEFTVKIAGQQIEMHRCSGHRLTDEFLTNLSKAERR